MPPQFQRCPQCNDPPKVYRAADIVDIVNTGLKAGCFVCPRCKKSVFVGPNYVLAEPPKRPRPTTGRNRRPPSERVPVLAESGEHIVQELIAAPEHDYADTVAMPKKAAPPASIDEKQAEKEEREAQDRRNLQMLQIMADFVSAIESHQVISRRFRLDAVLARGKFNVVARGLDLKTRKPVVIKCNPATALSEEDAALPQEKVKRSFEIQRRLAGKHVAAPLGLVRHPRFGYLLVDWLHEGKTLLKLIEERGALAEADVRKIGLQLAAVQKRCTFVTRIDGEEQRVVAIHRDIKPENIIVDSHGDIMLIDFDVARDSNDTKDNQGVIGDVLPEIDRAMFRATLTQAGFLIGTPYYMAPEQVDGGRLDGRTDLYAIGATMYHAITGTLPFNDENIVVLLEQVSSREPVPAHKLRPDLPISTEISMIIGKLMEKDRLKRFQNAQELATALAGADRRPARGNCSRVILLFLLLLTVAAYAWRHYGYPIPEIPW